MDLIINHYYYYYYYYYYYLTSNHFGLFSIAKRMKNITNYSVVAEISSKKTKCKIMYLAQLMSLIYVTSGGIATRFKIV